MLRKSGASSQTMGAYIPEQQQGTRRASLSMVSRWVERSRQRRALAELDGARLADVGLSRADVAQEVAKHFWE